MNFQEWEKLSDQKRSEIVKEWSPYNTSAVQPLLDDIVTAFKQEYPNYDIRGLGNVFGSLMIVVLRPFIFDKQKAPKNFLGLYVRYTLSEPVPVGFEIYKDYVWAPENFLAYVDFHAAEISDGLGNQSMTKEDMLDALVGMRFDDWIKQCQDWGYTNMSPGERTLPESPWWKLW